MYGVVWLLATAVAVCSGAETSPSGCKFGDSVAVCSNLEFDFKKLNVKLSTLKIVNPSSSLVLEKDFLKNVGLESINSLYIENAVITKIDKNAFRNLSELTNIKITNSKLPDIHPDTFVDCTNLRTLNLAGSSLQKFDYVKSESIEELDISNCSLIKISNANFDNLSELVYLNLAHNFITQIELSTFSNVINLEEINLSHNQIASIPSNLFENNTQLDTLDLSYNPLKKFRMSVVSDMEKLVLKGCKLTEFNSNSSKNLDLLAYLDLSDNQIPYLQQDALSPLTELEYVDLSNNSLTFIHPDTFKFNTKLQKIILDNNDLVLLPSFTGHQSTFETSFFSCNHCQLQLLPEDVFANMPALETVQLAHNNFENINLSFRNLGNLIRLDLSYNRIESIHKHGFAGNSALQHLILSGNPLTSVDSDLFEKNNVLNRLELSYCGLESLWTGNHRIMSLKYLDISNNLLKMVSQCDLNVTPALEVLDVAGNPLACDSNFCNFFQWINDRGVMQPAQQRKTHDVLLRDAGEFESVDRILGWYDVVKSTCGGIDACLQDDNDDDDDYDADDSEDSSEEYPEDKDANEVDTEVEPDDASFGVFTQFKITESTSHIVGRYSYIWPALVFIFTALLVLLIVANVLLLVLRKRGNLQLPRDGMPQIKIIPWSHGSKMKKHSGSVYQPLSEEKSEPTTPVFNRYQLVPNTPAVHKTTA